MIQKRYKDDFGYALRIAKPEWLEQVFESTRYYTGLQRSWRNGAPVLFVYNTKNGDAFVGYGVIKEALSFEELPETEQITCSKWGWKTAIDFDYIVRFNSPVLVKETTLAETRLRGKFLHALHLDLTFINDVISRAK